MEVYEEPCKRIWEGYKSYASGCGTMRKGFEVAGQACLTDDKACDIERFLSRGESILEHQAKVAWLCSIIVSNFPFIFYLMDPQLSADAWYLMTVALTHDVGESEIGDIPDDGRVEHGHKDSLERDFYEKFAKAYNPFHQKRLLELFKQFQDKNSLYGQLLYSLDKTEFVLMALLLEKNWNYGCLKLKNPPTSQDEYFMRVTGTSVASDCWAAHTKTLLLPLPSVIQEPILTLIDVAVRDVRGKPFKWWNDTILPWNGP